MTPKNYLDLDIQITRSNNIYNTRVLSSPSGQASSRFRVPFNNEELDRFINQLLQISNMQSSMFEQGMLKMFGSELFDALFQGEVLICLERSLDTARSQNAGLRIKLRLNDAPELLNIPWEYLYDTMHKRFLSLYVDTPIIHFVELPEPLQSLTVSPPIRILVMTSNPSDLQFLDVDQEWLDLNTALETPLRQKAVQLTRMPKATLPALQRILRQETFHVFHFIGHGAFDTVKETGLLFFTDENGMSKPLNAEHIGQLLGSHNSLRLVVLNACEGSRTTLADPFAGAAQILVREGIPAVIAMQFAISDTASKLFASEFYMSIADGYPIDASLAEARKAISTRQSGGEWGTPKLFMRAKNGLLWHIEQVTARGENFHNLLDKDTLQENLGILPSLMGTPIIRTEVFKFRAEFALANKQIDILGDYKDLHDLLHDLQFRCYNVIVREAHRFPEDTWAWDNLLTYEVVLQDIITRLRLMAKRNTFSPDDVSWIDQVVDAGEHLHHALENIDKKSLDHSIWLIKRIVALQPSSVNQRLNTAARALRLESIEQAMKSIKDKINHLDTEKEKLMRFEKGVTSLGNLNGQLNMVVNDHDRWQSIERMLNRIEDVMDYKLEEVQMSWPQLKSMIVPLCRDLNEEWVKLILEDGKSLDNAIIEQNPAKIRGYFQRYRQRAGARFYLVDKELKELCDDLRKIGSPLTSILQSLD